MLNKNEVQELVKFLKKLEKTYLIMADFLPSVMIVWMIA